ncbi:MAG TPA: AmmeMemoRadiSam system protein A [Thermoanaerobaculia bacterium]|nr:AmmeMemoRadiSam system protein A [Thermoanaerobaculia bacterium]
MKDDPPDPPFDRRERLALLAIARRSIEAELAGVPFSAGGIPPTPRLERHAAAFVSLRLAGALRGCVGSLDPDEPLWTAVAGSARAAAFRDPRFDPLTPSELSAVELEISVLGPFEPVGSHADITVGRHGVTIRHGDRTGLLLPQVPVELGWTLEQLLGHLCLKAGLTPRQWRDGEARLERFTAEVFSEFVENSAGSERAETIADRSPNNPPLPLVPPGDPRLRSYK